MEMTTPPKPSLVMALLRVLLITFIVGLLAFALSLLFGIAGFAIYSRASGNVVSMALAYRLVAVPFAITVAVIVFAISLSMEIKQYRLNKALASIEKAGSKNSRLQISD
jgi:hypothetical protein